MAGMIRHLPNTLTILRFPLTIIFIYGFLQPSVEWRLLASACFIFSAITDYLDGMLARKLNVISRIGAFLDPLADKFLVLAGFFVLYLRPDIAWEGWKLTVLISFIVIAAREPFVTVLRSYKEARGRPIVTSFIAKAKTTAQMITLVIAILLLASQDFFSLQIPYVIHLIGLGYIVSAVLAALSAIDYIRA